MTGDEELNIYLSTLQSIINDLNNVKEEIRTNIEGVGQENCISSLEFVSNCYTNIKNNVIRNYYIDINNK